MDRRALITLLALFAVLFLAFGGFLAALLGGGTDAGERGVTSGPRVRVLVLEGMIVDARPLLDDLQAARDDDDVKAIMLRVESSGGAVGPSQELFEAVREVADRKPVVASMGTVAASGGYYALAGATRIVASRASMTGSIGVISQVADLTELLDWVQLDSTTFKSGALKDAGSPLRPLADGDRALLGELVQELFSQFLGDVVRARGLSAEQQDAIRDGRILTGEQAQELGLVDELGGQWLALRLAGELAGMGPDPAVQWPRDRARTMVRELLSAASSEVQQQVHDQAQRWATAKLFFAGAW